MPLDMTPQSDPVDPVARLDLLQELLAKSGGQGDYRTCLWSEVRKVPVLRSLGNEPTAATLTLAAHFFGLDNGEMYSLISGSSKRTKTELIECLRAAKCAQKETANAL